MKIYRFCQGVFQNFDNFYLRTYTLSYFAKYRYHCKCSHCKCSHCKCIDIIV